MGIATQLLGAGPRPLLQHGPIVCPALWQEKLEAEPEATALTHLTTSCKL